MTDVTVLAYDDGQALGPLTRTRAAIDLRCGALRLWEKVEWAAGQRVTLLVPEALAAVTAERDPGRAVNPPSTAGSVVVVNARHLSAGSAAKTLLNTGDGGRASAAGEVIGVRVADANADRIRHAASWPEISALGDGPVVELTGPVGGWIANVWDLILQNKDQIAADFRLLGGSAVLGDVHPAATLYAGEGIRIEAGARVEAGAVLDARGGPIWVGAGAIIHPLSYVQGPAAIGSGTYVMSGARIREGSSFGNVCRVGGEIEESIFQGYGNKVHDGFVGHSYVGAWSNLGALTTTSDLKNTYGRVRLDLEHGTVDSGLTKLGSFLGDHTRLGIGTLLTSGCVIEPACNLFGGGLLPKRVEAFQWGGEGTLERYEAAKFFQTAEIAMSRRGVTMGPAERALLTQLSEQAAL